VFPNSCRTIRSFLLRALARVLGVLFLCTAVGRANAPDSQTTADVQCVVVALKLERSPIQREALSSEMLLSYFLGRIDGRSPNADLMTLVQQQAKKMTLMDLGNAARRCGSELAVRGQELTRIGKSLTAPPN
jgi:hypothetical protein